jgi:hypothetical protein
MTGLTKIHKISATSKYYHGRSVPYLQKNGLSVGDLWSFFYTLTVYTVFGKNYKRSENHANRTVHGNSAPLNSRVTDASAQRLQPKESKLTCNEPRLCGKLNFIKTN